MSVRSEKILNALDGAPTSLFIDSLNHLFLSSTINENLIFAIETDEGGWIHKINRLDGLSLHVQINVLYLFTIVLLDWNEAVISCHYDRNNICLSIIIRDFFQIVNNSLLIEVEVCWDIQISWKICQSEIIFIEKFYCAVSFPQYQMIIT